MTKRLTMYLFQDRILYISIMLCISTILVILIAYSAFATPASVSCNSTDGTDIEEMKSLLRKWGIFQAIKELEETRRLTEDTIPYKNFEFLFALRHMENMERLVNFLHTDYMTIGTNKSEVNNIIADII